jgi:hypothetical protein
MIKNKTAIKLKLICSLAKLIQLDFFLADAPESSFSFLVSTMACSRSFPEIRPRTSLIRIQCRHMPE